MPLNKETKISYFLFLFQWHINLLGLLNAKTIPVEEQLWYYFTHCCWDLRVHAFPKSMSPKVKVIARLELELAYFMAAVEHVKHHATRTFLPVQDIRCNTLEKTCNDFFKTKRNKSLSSNNPEFNIVGNVWSGLTLKSKLNSAILASDKFSSN